MTKTPEYVIYRYPHDRKAKNSDALIISSVRKYIKDENANLEIVRDEYGKPHIAGINDIYVSVTHDSELCLVAVAKTEIGIDIERADRKVKNPAALARRFFCEDEIAFLGDNPTPQSFTDMWVKKEALSKLIGKGVPCMHELSVFSDIVEIIPIDNYDKYIAYVAIYK